MSTVSGVLAKMLRVKVSTQGSLFSFPSFCTNGSTLSPRPQAAGGALRRDGRGAGPSSERRFLQSSHLCQLIVPANICRAAELGPGLSLLCSCSHSVLTVANEVAAVIIPTSRRQVRQHV